MVSSCCDVTNKCESMWQSLPKWLPHTINCFKAINYLGVFQTLWRRSISLRSRHSQMPVQSRTGRILRLYSGQAWECSLLQILSKWNAPKLFKGEFRMPQVNVSEHIQASPGDFDADDNPRQGWNPSTAWDGIPHDARFSAVRLADGKIVYSAGHDQWDESVSGEF